MTSAKLAASLLALATTLGSAQAADLKVMASNAIKSALEELGPQFEKSGHKITFKFKAAAELKADIEKGEAVDVAVLTAAGIDDLIKQGKFAADSKTVVTRSAIGVAIKKGAPKPDLSSADAFKNAVLAAKSIGVVEQGQTGTYMRQLFEKLGIADAVKPKLKLLPSTNPAAKAVGNGEAEIGMTQISEILPYADITELAGPLPAELQSYTAFTAGISAGAKDKAAAGALISFLRSPAALAVLKAKGLEP